MSKLIYDFSEGTKEDLDLLGGKGANLAEMTSLELPVPFGFTITTGACMDYLDTLCLSQNLLETIKQYVTLLENKTNKQFGATRNPLLVSVRSGSKFSMPGMMDTILNLGLNDQTVVALATATGNPAFAYDCYRRLIQMYADVVKGVDRSYFENYLDHYKKEHDYTEDNQLTGADWQRVTEAYQLIYMEHIKEKFPQDPFEQLTAAVQAVFASWNNPRAKTYRRLHQISDDLGTAVNIQAMVFGNTGDQSGTGVAFTRNPATGETGIFGEYLINAQGEDVVAGIRTPKEISQLQTEQPEVYQQFEKICGILEDHNRDMQDIEFTIENGELFILQTRNGKRTAKAAMKIAIDLAESGAITKQEALNRITPEMINQSLHPVFDEEALKNAEALVSGLPASPGAATGKIYFTAAAAKDAHDAGEKVILLRQDTSPEDIEGMVVSEAIVTSRGGMTSHAAVVARGMGTCCIVGCEALEVDEFMKRAKTGDVVLEEGDIISVNGSSGKVYLGKIPTTLDNDFSKLSKILEWGLALGDLKVRANAETAEDIQTALKFGAAGIGLARTEHMFFGEERIWEMRKMILADTKASREQALANLEVFQIQDFREIFSLTAGLPCTIRLLDPPLHEFVPKEEDLKRAATETRKSLSDIRQRIAELEEVNPMLGHRGCRLGVTYPEIYEMQTRAIIKAALEVSQAQNIQVIPEIMLPLISEKRELDFLREVLEKTIQEVFDEYNFATPYKIGSMLEIPRACLTADQLAENSDFFSFGTNDLTQLTYGFSRDDSVKFIPEYMEKHILANDPYQHLDTQGVGELMRTAVNKVTPLNQKISFGVCGEVGGDPASIAFLREIGVDYVSCSPYRIPAAILAVAQSSV
ncbi:pyruvate, phosphate dikinase [Enterococcus sp. LJL120]